MSHNLRYAKYVPKWRLSIWQICWTPNSLTNFAKIFHLLFLLASFFFFVLCSKVNLSRFSFEKKNRIDLKVINMHLQYWQTTSTFNVCDNSFSKKKTYKLFICRMESESRRMLKKLNVDCLNRRQFSFN